MSSLFDEIQQRAEKLNTDVRLGDISEFRIPTQASPTKVFYSSKNAKMKKIQGTSACSSSLLDAGLDEIFRQSEEIWNKKQSLRPVAGMGAALRTTKDLSQLNTTRLTPAMAQKRAEPQKPIEDYEGVTKAMADGQFPDEEVDKYVQRAFERARIEAERTFLNQQILERPQSSAALFSPKRGQQRLAVGQDKPTGTGMKHFGNLPSSPLAHEQNVFAQKIDAALTVDCKTQLFTPIKEAVKKLNTKEADYIWSKVFAIIPPTSMVKAGEDVRVFRSKKQWLDHVVEAGTKYLQNELALFMENIIEANLAKARRGGCPGTLPTVEAYLNVKGPFQQQYEDCNYGQQPVWTVLFYCLRLGDLEAVSRVAKEKLLSNAQCTALVGILTGLPTMTSIDEDRRIKLRAEWKQNAQACQDIHKKAVYGLFLGFDCPEANQNIEDWLWSRLFACKYAPEPGRALRQLQTTICFQHGEKYFIGEGGSHLIYFTVLLLTGQLERAAHVLFKTETHRVHGVHIALLAQQARLLFCTDKVSSEILVQDPQDPSICQLNFARLLLLYVKDFELTSVNHALNYCFFLRDFQLDAMAEGKSGRSVFEACVSRIVFLTGERDAILGQLNPRGERVPGLVDKFGGALNISDVIARVAADTNVQGDPLGACHLYALANRPEEATKLACYQLSQCIANPTDPTTQKAIDCARWLAQRYNRPNVREENAQLATLHQLLDLHAFFALAAEGKHQQAVELLQRMRFVPADPEDVQPAVSQFHLVPEETRPLLPAICTQLMRSIVSLHEGAPPGTPATVMLKQLAKALILYTAMIPYRFPVSTNSLLLQLQSRII